MSGFVIGHVRQIEIRVSWSVAVIVGIVSWSLADGLLPEYAEGYTNLEYWATAAVLAFALLAGLVAHELGHSLVAARQGVTVDSITLWMFGGVARLMNEPATPRNAIRIAAAGPGVSAGIGITALSASVFDSGLLGVALAWFGAINLMLAAFNLLPAFPMDGGRIYQAWLWARSGDRPAATRRAAAVGHTIGGVMVGLGLLEVLLAGAIGGVWLALIGWFVREAARAEVQGLTIDGPLRQIAVSQIMTSTPEQVIADRSVQSFVSEMLFGGRHAAYPVVRHDGSVVGLVTVNAVRSLDRERWETTTIGAVARPLAELTVVAPGSTVADLVGVMAADQEARALVMQGDHLVGIVSPSDVARLVTAVELVGPAGPNIEPILN